MIKLHDFQQISEYEWEIPVTFRREMHVPVRFYATRDLLESALQDASIEQAVNVTCLPGLAGPVVVMPDMHQGYGFPIGGVAATLYPQGVISPGGIGYDINCGVRLLASAIPFSEAQPWLEELATALDHFCPSGVGVKGGVKLSPKDLERVCIQGARWAVEQGYGLCEDLFRTEQKGCLPKADLASVSNRARERGATQLGTLGAGNHFIEIDLIDEIFDLTTAQVFGLQQGNLAVQIHCGSRGFGHQVCTDTVQSFQQVVQRYGIHLPDRELVCAPLDSPEGQRYFSAMCAAANYAFANRQVLAHNVRQAFEQVLAGKVKHFYLRQVYDVAHNLGNIETHTIAGKAVQVCVHRKGATRAFGPHTPGVPEEYQNTGQPVLVPGSMGTASWVLAGTETSMQRTYGSSCHGAGRVMSRSQAKKQLRGERLKHELEKDGILIRAGSLPGLAEEAPQAYKDVDGVVKVVCGAGIARKVARLTPLVVIKG